MALRPPPPVPEIPHAKEAPLIGSLVPFAKGAISFLRRLRDEYGDIVQFTVANHRIVLLNEPDLIEAALVGRWRQLHKDAMYDLTRPLLGNGLVTSEGDEWKRNRRLIAPSFTPKHIEGYRQTMERCVEQWIGAVQPGESIDLFEGMMALTQQLVLQTLFGELDVDVSEAGPCIGIVMEEFVHDGQGRRRLLPRWLPTPGRRRSARAVATLDALMARILAARRAKGLGDDLLSRLMAARDDDGQGLSDKQLRDEAITLFSAGHETTATALTYTLLLLAQHPEEERRLVDDPSRAVPVLKEAMRLLPPVWAIGRETQETVEIGDYTIPPDIQLLISMSVLHSDPRWFPQPELFRPDRWLEEPDLPRMAYLPFGGGARVCVGNHFAMMEAEIALRELVGRLQFRPASLELPPMTPSITLRPTEPIATVVTRR